MYRFCLAICLGLTIVWTFGCAPAPKGAAPAAPVKGTVNMDGKPVPKGDISFGVLGVPPKVMQITDGTYSGEAPIGQNQVEVFIYVEGPPNPRYPDVPTKTNITPDTYWGPRTTLSANVTKAGPNEFKFDLTSKGSAGAAMASPGAGKPTGGAVKPTGGKP